MKTAFKGFAAAALLLAASHLPVRAEDAPAATTAPAATQGTTTPADAKPADAKPADAKPAVTPRPSIAPKAVEAAPDASNEPAPRRHRRYARQYRRYAYWQPFPIYFPHLYHNRLVWNRAPWF